MLAAQLSGNLSDLQAKFRDLISTISLPTNNCQSFSTNNPVVRISSQGLRLEEGQAVLTLQGDVDVWDCRQNPVPNTKVEWELKDVGLGVKTKVPIVRTSPGNPIKNKVANGAFEVVLPIILLHSETKLEIKTGNPEIKVGGRYVTSNDRALTIAGVNMSEEINKILGIVIDPNDFKKELPPDISKLDPKIERAYFKKERDTLGIGVDFTTLIPRSSTEVIDALMSAPIPQ
jgi:hypothetical protein